VLWIVWGEASGFVRIRTAFALVLVISTALLAPLGPLALKMMVDRFTGDAAWAIGSVTLLIGLYIFSQWFPRFINEARNLVYARAERRMFRTLSERLFSHIMRLPMRFHLNRQTGAINQIVVNGLQGYQTATHSLVFTFLPIGLQLATISLVLIQLGQPTFLILFGLAMACYATAFGIFALRLGASARSASESQIDATAVMTDSIMNYETVKYFAAESVVQNRVSRALQQNENTWIGFYRKSALNGLVIATLFASVLAVSICYSTYRVHAGLMTVGDFILVNTYMLQVVAPLEAIGFAVQGFVQALAMLDKMLELLREPAEPHQTGNHLTLPFNGELVFDHVSLSYRPDRMILRDISFRIAAGKTLAIVGPSGAGKSTIVRLLMRLFEPDAGRISLDGIPISELSLTTLRRSIAVVPQDTVLFNDTIGYNIAFGREGSTSEDVERATKVAHLHELICELPDRYETEVGERGAKLSGGEKQRVSIARAAIKQPRIYVFDEATSSLDSATEKEILANIRELSRTATTLIVAHRLSTVAHADEILVLDDGMVAERGTHQSLLRFGGRYAGLWHTQQQAQGPDGVDSTRIAV
jgi:ATP-binding cassette subfamily B protein